MVPNSPMNHSRQDAVRFFTELRSRLIATCVVLFGVFAILLYFANDLYTWFAYPLLRALPEGHFIATHLVSPVLVPFKLAFFVALFVVMPYFLYQLWSFISPALYRYEKRTFLPSLLMSVVLFYTGIAFGYEVIFPMLFRVIAHLVPQGVVLSPDMNDYLDLTTKLLLVFGLLFEIPMVMVWLDLGGIVPRTRFIAMRAYAVLGAFIVAMLLAPPDVLSQTVLAIPIWLLYEFGIILSGWRGKLYVNGTRGSS